MHLSRRTQRSVLLIGLVAAATICQGLSVLPNDLDPHVEVLLVMGYTVSLIFMGMIIGAINAERLMATNEAVPEVLKRWKDTLKVEVSALQKEIDCLDQLARSLAQRYLATARYYIESETTVANLKRAGGLIDQVRGMLEEQSASPSLPISPPGNAQDRYPLAASTTTNRPSAKTPRRRSPPPVDAAVPTKPFPPDQFPRPARFYNQTNTYVPGSSGSRNATCYAGVGLGEYKFNGQVVVGYVDHRRRFRVAPPDWSLDSETMVEFDEGAFMRCNPLFDRYFPEGKIVDFDEIDFGLGDK